MTILHLQRRHWFRLAGVTAMALATMSPSASFAQARVAEAVNPPAAPAVTIPVYGVAECIQIAYERQPALAAARASLQAKQAARDGLSQPRLLYLFAPDINLRRQQSCKGVSAATAELMQAEHDTAYAVTRTYYTAIYARLQYDVAAGMVSKLQLDRADLKRLVDAADPNYTAPMLDRLDIAIGLAQAKQQEADEGMRRALAALREAMGMGLECSSFQLADLSLPDPYIKIEKCDIINLALSRRGEMMQVLMAADVVRLEIDAQGRHWLRPLVGTFASGADIHATQVPPGIRNGDYRPGAVGPEMPVNLAGPRSARVEQARAYSDRADAVVNKTRELVALEAEDAYYKWEESSRKVGFTRDASNKAKKYVRQLEEDKAAGAKISPEDLTTNRILAAQASVAFNEAMFYQVLALANLERITAGGFSAGFAAPKP